MSEDNTQEGAEAAEATPPAAPVAEYATKGEMERKFDHLNASFERVTKMLEGSIRPQQPQQPQAPKKVSVWDNEDEFASTIAERATQQATDIAARMIQTQKQFDAAVAQATSNYPELNDPNTNAYKILKQKLETQDPSLKGTPQGFRMAVLEAAAEEALVPAPKRKKSEAATGSDDFTIGSSSNNPRSRASREREATEQETEFAQLIGAPMDNKDFQKFFKQALKRTNWSGNE